jgi:hypothetical protein
VFGTWRLAYRFAAAFGFCGFFIPAARKFVALVASRRENDRTKAVENVVTVHARTLGWAACRGAAELGPRVCAEEPKGDSYMLKSIGLMDNERLGEVLAENCEVVDAGGEANRWLVEFGGYRMLVVTDEAADRMRIMATIASYDELRVRDFRVLLAANFDRTLDARYATAGGYLWAVYLHPLAELTEDQLAEGLRQVAALARNYGTSYAASDLTFTGGSGVDEPV